MHLFAQILHEYKNMPNILEKLYSLGNYKNQTKLASDLCISQAQVSRYLAKKRKLPKYLRLLIVYKISVLKRNRL